MGILGEIIGGILATVTDPSKADRLVEHSTSIWERRMDQAQRDYQNGRIGFDEYNSIMQRGIEVLQKAGEWEAKRSKYNR